MTNEASRKLAVSRLKTAARVAGDAQRTIVRAQEFAETADMPKAAQRIGRLADVMQDAINRIVAERDILIKQRAPENVSGLAGGKLETWE